MRRTVRNFAAVTVATAALVLSAVQPAMAFDESVITGSVHDASGGLGGQLWPGVGSSRHDRLTVTVSGRSDYPVDVRVYRGSDFLSSNPLVATLATGASLTGADLSYSITEDLGLPAGDYYVAVWDPNPLYGSGDPSVLGRLWRIASFSVWQTTVDVVSASDGDAAYPYEDGYRDEVDWDLYWGTNLEEPLPVTGTVSIINGARSRTVGFSTTSWAANGRISAAGLGTGKAVLRYVLKWGNPAKEIVVDRHVTLLPTRGALLLGGIFGSYYKKVWAKPGTTPLYAGALAMTNHLKTPYRLRLSISHRGHVIWRYRGRITAPTPEKAFMHGNVRWKHGRLGAGSYRIDGVLTGPDGAVARAHTTWTSITKAPAPINR